MKIDQIEPFLRGCSCFAVLTESELATVREQAEVRHFKLGEVVFREGDPGDRMYLVYSGKVRVLRRQNGDEVPLNTLCAGEHFGEMALLGRKRRSATIRAADDSTLIAIPASAIATLAGANSELRSYFDHYAERVELWNFVKLVGQVGPRLKPPQLRQLVDQFQELLSHDGEQILTEGQPPKRFYLIQSGRVKVIRRDKIQATLTAGDSFGGLPLLEEPPGASLFTIRADGPVTTLTLSAAEFRRLLHEAPHVRLFFEEQQAQCDAGQATGHFAALSDRLKEEETGPPDSSNLNVNGEATDGEVFPYNVEPTLPAAAAPLPKPLNWRQRWGFSFISQHDQADCGAACLAMITAHHGRAVGVSRLRDLAGVSTDGASLAQLAQAAHEIGYEARGLRLSVDRLDRLRLPAVLFWKGHHYVVLYALTPTYAHVADPALGKLRLSRHELAQSYSGYALEMTPTGAAAAIRPRSSAVGRFLRLAAGQKKTLVVILLCSLLLEVFGLAPALFTRWIMDSVLPQQDYSLLTLVALGVFLVSVLQIATTIVRGLVSVRLSQRLDRGLLLGFYTHLFSLPTRFFKLRRTGDIVARFDDNQHVRFLFTAGTMAALLDSLMVVVYFALMFSWNVRLAFVVLAFVPFFVGFTLLVSPVMKKQYRRSLEDQAAQESNLIESIGGIDLIKAMAIEKPMQQKWEGLFNKSLSTQFRSEKLGQVFGALGGALGVLSTVALLWYGAVLVLQDQLTVGEYMAFSMLAGQVTGPLASVIGLWDTVQHARVALERMNDVLDSDPEPQPAADTRVYPEALRGHVKMERLFFHYGNKNAAYVLRNINCEARPGQRIAIVGRSGSGKTTLARLLLGMYQPTEGRITIDGWDLNRLDLATYRRQVGFVLQENLLFSGTIRENVSLGDPQPDLRRIKEAANQAGAHEFIAAMPLGYDTVVGELGLTLSGGQRQRISIARALYRDPRILVLDEATSALDSISEREIQKNLDAILADRTTFIIAHKISTVRSAHQILVLHEGALVEQGTHDELIARRGTYYYLAAQQLNL